MSVSEERRPDPRRRELAYEVLNGYMEAGPMGEALEEARMQIDFAAEMVYQHRINLCEKAKLDFEDKELLGLMSAFERLGRLCAEMMYDQGWHDASVGL